MKRSAGFTLVEVLVAVVVMAIIGLASAAVIHTMMRSSEQSKAALLELEELQFAMLTLEQDVRQIIKRSNITRSYLLIDENRLAFIRTGWLNPQGLFPRSELQPVAYFIRDDALIREHYYYVDVSESTEPIARQLLTGVTGLEVTPLSDAEVRNWSKRNAGLSAGPRFTHQLPPALEVTLTTERWGTITRVFLIAEGGDDVAPES